jgi:hypothetical protein
MASRICIVWFRSIKYYHTMPADLKKSCDFLCPSLAAILTSLIPLVAGD